MARSVKWRRVFLVLAIVMAVVGLGGATAAILTYHEATKIDRSNPKVVAAEYLRAVFVKRDGIGADLYSCDNRAGLKPMVDLSRELEDREKQFEVEVLVSWGAMERRDDGSRILLITGLIITGTKDGAVTSERTEKWQLSLIEEDGWRVCGADRLDVPSASASQTPSAG